MRPQFSFTRSWEKGLHWFTIWLEWLLQHFVGNKSEGWGREWRYELPSLKWEKRWREVFWKSLVQHFLTLSIQNEMGTQVFMHIKINMNIGIFKFCYFSAFLYRMIAIFPRALCTNKNIQCWYAWNKMIRLLLVKLFLDTWRLLDTLLNSF